jgi:Holliday junction resolvasome RuvABC endonuclease subunit
VWTWGWIVAAKKVKRTRALRGAGRKPRGAVLLVTRHIKRKKRAPAAEVRRRKAAHKAQWKTSGDGSRLLALDVSSRAVGWALFEHNKLLTYGKYEHVGDAHGEKLHNYLEWLAALFAEVHPTSVAVEAAFQGRHRNAFAVLTLYRAALLVAHMRTYGRELPDKNQIPPHLIKRVLAVPKGTHTENKARVVAVINQLYGTAFRFDAARPDDKARNDDDIADAVAVGHAWCALWAEPADE